MRPNVALICLCAGLALALLGQWRLLSRARAENRMLIQEKLSAETVKAENRRLTEQVAQNEIEAQTLRDENVALKSEAQRLGREVVSLKAGVLRSPEVSTQIAADRRSPSSLSGHGPFFHMQPGVLTNLGPVSAEDMGPNQNSFFLDDVELATGLSKQSILSGPNWTPSEPLPLGLADVEQIARAQLRTIVQDEPSWVVLDISLLRLSEPNLQGSPKWQYTVMLGPRPDLSPITSAGHINTFTAHVSMSGEVGSVGLRGAQ